MLIPLVVALSVYGGAYLIAWLAGWVSFQPAWPSDRIAINLAVNIPLLVVIKRVGSIGEELGWRRYLQPRLDQAGVRYSVVWVGLMWFLFHLPIMLIGGYQQGGTFGAVLLMFAVACVADAVVWTWACYRQKSLWPAIWFHTSHNMTSQWLLPKFFPVADGGLLLGEDGILPTVLHVLAAVLVVFLARRPLAAASTTAGSDPSAPPG
jgi:membrane protease YdiL (CAAX protease family)